MEVTDVQKEELLKKTNQEIKVGVKKELNSSTKNDVNANSEITTEVIEMHEDNIVDLSSLVKVQDDSVLYNIKQAETWAPTYNPKTYKEQFYFQDDGSMWANINNVWTKVWPSASTTSTIIGKMTKTDQQLYTTWYAKVALNSSIYAEWITVDTANNRITVITPWYYNIIGQLGWDTLVADKYYSLYIVVWGTSIWEVRVHSSVTNVLTENIQNTIYLNAGDYVELYAYSNSGWSVYTKASATNTFLSVNKI